NDGEREGGLANPDAEYQQRAAVVAFGATWVHAGAGWVFSNEGGGWEYPLFLGIACIAQALLGPGALTPSEFLRREAAA
ncbi:MAG: hypothetical protein AAFX10_16940, partial [Pseudomonadota bacterium]